MIDGQIVPASATTTVSLGNASSGQKAVSRWVVQLKSSSWTSSTVTPKGRVFRATGLTSTDDQALAYTTAAAPGTYVTTAIAADGVYYIIADGLHVDLVCVLGAATVSVWAQPLAG